LGVFWGGGGGGRTETPINRGGKKSFRGGPEPGVRKERRRIASAVQHTKSVSRLNRQRRNFSNIVKNQEKLEGGIFPRKGAEGTS